MTIIKWLGASLSLILIAGLCYVSAWHLFDDQPKRAPIMGGPTGFDSMLLAASDVDQYFGAYADGVLKQIPNLKDTISVLAPTQTTSSPIGTAPASHSVISWPQIIDVSNDARFAFIAETRGKPNPSTKKVPDVYATLPEGRLLTILDISNPANPTVLSKTDIGGDLWSVMANKQGNQLAIATTDALKIVDLNDGAIAAIHDYPIEKYVGFDVIRPGLKAAAWHPDGKHLALQITEHALEFYRLGPRDASGKPTLLPVGERLMIGETLTAGAFHPNGKFFLITDVVWGSNSVATDFLFNKNGVVHVVQFDPDGAHKVLDPIEVKRSPEGFSISPDGRSIVTVNMNRSYLPPTPAFKLVPGRLTPSLSLISFNPETGAGKVIHSAGFSGYLPEDATFDQDSNALAVAIFEQSKEQDNLGYVAYWRIENGKLVRTGVRTPVARGVHDLVTIPN